MQNLIGPKLVVAPHVFLSGCTCQTNGSLIKSKYNGITIASNKALLYKLAIRLGYCSKLLTFIIAIRIVCSYVFARRLICELTIVMSLCVSVIWPNNTDLNCLIYRLCSCSLAWCVCHNLWLTCIVSFCAHLHLFSSCQLSDLVFLS